MVQAPCRTLPCHVPLYTTLPWSFLGFLLALRLSKLSNYQVDMLHRTKHNIPLYSESKNMGPCSGPISWNPNIPTIPSLGLLSLLERLLGEADLVLGKLQALLMKAASKPTKEAAKLWDLVIASCCLVLGQILCSHNLASSCTASLSMPWLFILTWRGMEGGPPGGIESGLFLWSFLACRLRQTPTD